MNETLTLPAKRNKRFALGGVFCIICSLYIGIELLIYALLGDSFIEIIQELMLLFTNMGTYGISYALFSMEVLNVYMAYAIFFVSFLTLGILLLCKVHSKLLIVFPILQAATLLFKLVTDLINDALWIVCSYGYYIPLEEIKDGDEFSRFFEDLFSGSSYPIIHTIEFFPVRYLLTLAIVVAVCVLAAVVIILNCGKNKGGKLKSMKIIAPVLVAVGGFVHVAEFIIYPIAKNLLIFAAGRIVGYGSHVTSYYDFSARSSVLSFIFNSLLDMLGMPNMIVAWFLPNTVDIIVGIVPLALIVLAVFFSLSWIIDPYKKDESETAKKENFAKVSDVTETEIEDETAVSDETEVAE